jgi:hypothetical protein
VQLPDHGFALFAKRGDQQRRGQQDRHRQRDGDKDDRCFHHGSIAMLITAKIANGLKSVSGYAGIGIAIETLIESNVRVTIRHSDSEPIASVAATASASRDEATGAEGLSKPAGPGDRIMAEILTSRANHPQHPEFCRNRRQYCGGARLENGKMAAGSTVMPAV